MLADAVRPSEAMFFEPRGSVQRSMFRSYTRAGIIKPEGARWYLDLSAYGATKCARRKKAIIVAALLAVAAGLTWITEAVVDLI